MNVGFQLSRFAFPDSPQAIGANVAAIVRNADDAGFASLWEMDHFFQIANGGPPEDPMLEAYTTLGFAAGISQNLKLGTLVTGVTYRHPGLLAKTVTTLDVLSGGRAYLGIGAAWFEREHHGLGVPFPALKERFERLEETLQIFQQMQSGEAKPFDGTHYHLAETLNSPPAVTAPRIPIMIGGSGEQKTLRLVAKYGDACNLFGGPELPHKLDVLKRRCDEVGRDYGEIEKTTMVFATRSFDGVHDDKTSDEILEILQQHAELGIDQVILKLPTLTDPDTLTRLGQEVVQPAKDFAVAGR